jgi:hypothetical protein
VPGGCAKPRMGLPISTSASSTMPKALVKIYPVFFTFFYYRWFNISLQNHRNRCKVTKSCGLDKRISFLFYTDTMYVRYKT